MKIEKLKDYYNKIDQCTILIEKDVDFEYIQTQISKIAIYTEELNKIIGEILIDKTRLEHLITDKTFEYELRFTQYLSDDLDVKKFTTGKERKDYINYYLLRDEYKELVNLQQENKDIQSLLELAKKKARDLDKTYPKLKILWEAILSEIKYIKKIGSDSEYISKIKDKIKEDNVKSRPIFEDSLVEEIKNGQYNYDIKEKSANSDYRDHIDQSLITDQDNEIEDLDILLQEL